MSGAELTLVASVFLASAVEAVEALTVVLAVGTTRGWRSSLLGVAAAVVALGALVAVFGVALTKVPIDVLRTFVGAFLLLFGLQWLTKAILRAAGLLAIHDEELAYRRERESARAAGATGADVDRYALAVSFKAVLLEGLEVALIVITFGASQRRVGLAALAAGVSILVVAGLGFALRTPLARVPENALKLTVGVLLTAFGTFWAAEGVGAQWPGGEAALPVLIATVLAFALLLAASLRRRAGEWTTRGGPAAAPLGRLGTALSFFIGDDWLVACGATGALALTALLANVSPAWYPMPVAMLALLWSSVARSIQRTAP